MEDNECTKPALGTEALRSRGPRFSGFVSGAALITAAFFLGGSLRAGAAQDEIEELPAEEATTEDVAATEEVVTVEEEVPVVDDPPVVEEADEVDEVEETEETEGESTFYNELLVVVGAKGEDEYGQIFAKNQALWQAAADRGQVRFHVIGAEEENALDAVETYLAESSKDLATPLWILFIGHGTFDRREAYFNLAGPDLSAKELGEWLEPFTRPVIILNTASSSGAFLRVLSKPGRIVVTATKSGNEVNFASFGSYFAKALLEPEADFNNDGENSVFELYQYAARQTADFYEQEGRIQTETPLIDDNGDGRGTSLEALAALREGGSSSREPDGSFAKRWALVLSPMEQAIPAEMRQKRNVLESQIEGLRRRRSDLDEDVYYERLEALAVQIANLYAELEGEEVDDEVKLELEEKVEAEVDVEIEIDPEEGEGAEVEVVEDPFGDGAAGQPQEQPRP